jgi:sugar/nucleoside kinase (ribokinase family)
VKKSKSGITVAGSIIADMYYEIDTYPNQGFLTQVRATSFNVGGTGNLILDLAKLDPDLDIKVCAIVGEDEKGTEIVKSLRRFSNIDINGITVKGESAVTMVMNAEDTKQRTFFYIPGANDVFDESYINWDSIDSKIFHLEYLLLMKKVDEQDVEFGTHAAKILSAAKKRGMITSIDMVSEQSERVKSVVIPALKYTDICCINESEAEAITDICITENDGLSAEKAREAVLKLQEMGVSRWIVIHAPKMSFGYDCISDEFVSVESLKLPTGFIKGSTGAGDAYCSGILYGFYKDMPITEAMLLARGTAACSLSENNGTDGMRSYSGVLDLADRYKP